MAWDDIPSLKGLAPATRVRVVPMASDGIRISRHDTDEDAEAEEEEEEEEREVAMVA